MPMPESLQRWVKNAALSAIMDPGTMIESAEALWELAADARLLSKDAPELDGLEQDLRVLERFWTVPLSREPGEIPTRAWKPLGELDPLDLEGGEAMIARIARGARALIAIARGRAVFQDDLAALLACSRGRIRAKIEKGTLQTEPYNGPPHRGSPPVMISAASARAMLEDLRRQAIELESITAAPGLIGAP